jgi:glucose/arabinose dehydrogenase
MLGCVAFACDDGDDDDDRDDASTQRPDASRDASRPPDASGDATVPGDRDSAADEDAAIVDGDAGNEPPRAVFRPERRDFSPALLAQLQLPQGFAIDVFASELENPRMLAVGPDGSVYVSRPMRNDVVRLIDSDGDGRSDATSTAVSGIAGVHGLAIHEGQIFLAAVAAVHVAPLAGDGTIGTPSVLIGDLPDGGQHPNRTIAVGPDRMLYVSIGSSCDACMESNPEHATILQTALDGSGRRVFARGLRNTIGFDFHPDDGAFWGSDHGSDWRGNEEPPDEINRVVDGADYGWPYCFGARRADPVIMPPPNMTTEAYCAMTEPAVFEYEAHSAPIGLVFYDAMQFPVSYRGDAFVAFRGSWNRYPATGYKVVRVRYEGGAPSAVEDFVSGFLIEDGTAHFARLAGLAVATDGALLVSDDTNGIVYRVAYAGD